MRVLFFAHLKDVTDCAEISFSGEGMDVDSLWSKLIEMYPDIGCFRNSVRLARNYEYVDLGVRFTDADEIALIPPVSGG